MRYSFQDSCHADEKIKQYALHTLFNKNQAAWYFVRPAQAVTW